MTRTDVLTEQNYTQLKSWVAHSVLSTDNSWLKSEGEFLGVLPWFCCLLFAGERSHYTEFVLFGTERTPSAGGSHFHLESFQMVLWNHSPKLGETNFLIFFSVMNEHESGSEIQPSPLRLLSLQCESAALTPQFNNNCQKWDRFREHCDICPEREDLPILRRNRKRRNWSHSPLAWVRFH